jgi:hypothetical protein
MVDRLIRRWLAGLVVVITAGCGDVATPVEVTRQATSNGDNHLEALARYKTRPQILIALAKKTIGPEGGTISILDFEVVVPPGAVDKPTRFSIRLPIDDPFKGDYVVAEFSPHNLKFNVPVTLRLPYKGTTAETISGTRILWWNGSYWVPFETILREDGRLETKTDHFSEYGTEFFFKGIVLVGG